MGTVLIPSNKEARRPTKDKMEFLENYPECIVAKKWDPGILDPSRFSGQIRKVEARLGKLAKIRKVETD